MVWIGKIDEKFLKEKSILALINIIEKKKDTLKISVQDQNKDEFVQKATKLIRGKSYGYLVKTK